MTDQIKMKVKEIYIKEFRQFKDFTLDLTYPKGHAKEGLPLDKVCFIGQSGTGKTNLLKLLYLLRMPGESNKKPFPSPNELINQVAFSVVSSDKKELIASLTDGASSYSLSENLMSSFNTKSYTYKEILNKNFITHASHLEELQAFIYYEAKENGKLIYFPARLEYELKEKEESEYNLNERVFDFSKVSIYEHWKLIAKDVSKYQEQVLKFRQKISILSEQGKDNSKEVENLGNWKENNLNPIKPIAEECIDPLIKSFLLKVKQEFIIEQKEDIGFIKLENIEGKEIPYDSWSTGTKQVVLSALPLYLIKPENSTILFDEPETSLYPDLQRIIIEYYTNLVKENNQFFYATHSPIIASSFEPWEIVELKFDNAGFVEREKYYEGENHVDNYYIDPRYLNFDLTLKEVFDLEDTSGEKRYEALTKYGMLRNQLETLKTNGKLQTDEAKAIFKEFKSLSKKLAINPTQQYAQA